MDLTPNTERFGFSLTLSAKDLRARAQLLRAFDNVLRSVKLLSEGEVQTLRRLAAPDKEKPDADDALILYLCACS